MKKTFGFFIGLCLICSLAGCSADTPQGTETDKANLDRLSKEGIGGPPPAGGSGGSTPAPSGTSGGATPNSEPLTP